MYIYIYIYIYIIHIYIYIYRRSVHCLLLASAWVCWALGVCLPLVELLPFPFLQDAGDDLDLGAVAGQMVARRRALHLRKSTMETLRLLLDSGYYLAFTILLNCSVLVPILKLAAATLVMAQASWASAPPMEFRGI